MTKRIELPTSGKKSRNTGGGGGRATPPPTPSLNYPCGLVLGNSRDTLDYNEEAFALSIGSLIGDGHLRPEGRLEIEQGELEYTEWKKQQFEKYGLATQTSSISKVPHIRTDKITGEVTKTIGYRFYSRSFFKSFRCFVVQKKPGDPTYQEGKKNKKRKAFPKELFDCFVHPLALAVFYMDDGGAVNNQPYLATGEVPEKEVLLLQKVLETNFRLTTTIRRSKGIAVGLLVKRCDCGKFLDFVEPYVRSVPCMERKLKITRP